MISEAHRQVSSMKCVQHVVAKVHTAWLHPRHHLHDIEFSLARNHKPFTIHALYKVIEIPLSVASLTITDTSLWVQSCRQPPMNGPWLHPCSKISLTTTVQPIRPSCEYSNKCTNTPTNQDVLGRLSVHDRGSKFLIMPFTIDKICISRWRRRWLMWAQDQWYSSHYFLRILWDYTSSTDCFVQMTGF